MIIAKFSPYYRLTKERIFVFKSYRSFFKWFTRHYEKGAIYGVKEYGKT